jgi:hypothetical protein
MLDVVRGAGEEVVNAKDFIASLEQTLAKVRA